MTTHIDPLSQMIETACEAAIRRAMGINPVLQRRLLTTKQAAAYLTLCEREIYNMIGNRQLASVRYGKRVMIDIHDLDEWIAIHRKEV
jgi:excisionase family DNA binding protein